MVELCYGVENVTHPGGDSISAIQTLLSLASTARIKGLTAAASRKRQPCLDLAIQLPRFIGALLQTPVYASLGSLPVIPHVIWRQHGTAREVHEATSMKHVLSFGNRFFTAGCYLDHHSLCPHLLTDLVQTRHKNCKERSIYRYQKPRSLLPAPFSFCTRPPLLLTW